MGYILLAIVLMSQWEGDTVFSISTDASLSGALAYNYVDPYLYIMNYSFENPAAARGMRGAFINPSALALIRTSSGVVSAGFGRTGGLDLRFSTQLPYVGEMSLPISFYAEEESGVYTGGAAVRIGELVVGLGFVQGDRFSGEFKGRGELAFKATYSYHDTLTSADLPQLEETDTIPILIDLYGDGGGLLAILARARLRSTPLYLMLATQDKGVNYGLSFRFNTIEGFIDYTDTLTPVLRPSGANLYSESNQWDVGVAVSALIEGGELYSNRYVSSIRGSELGAVLGASKQTEEFSWGVSIEQNLGAKILKSSAGSRTRGGLPKVVELNTQNLEVDVDARTIKGEMSVVLGYDDYQEQEGSSTELLNLPPRTGLKGGIEATPGNWIIDATIATASTWGRGSSEIFFATGFGHNFHISVPVKDTIIDWQLPLRFSQAIFYRVTKIEEIPLYTIPGLFFGVSTTLVWKGIELDISLRTNTTTALFSNYASALDPTVPDLGIFNYLSAGAALNYAF